MRAAEDLEGRARDARRVVRGEEEDGLRDVARPQLLGERLRMQALALLLAILDGAGADGVDGDVVRRNSRASACVMPIRPNFAALWATTFASPRMPWTEETLTIRPRRRSTIPGSTARQKAAAPERFVAMTRSHSSGESFRKGRQ